MKNFSQQSRHQKRWEHAEAARGKNSLLWCETDNTTWVTHQVSDIHLHHQGGTNICLVFPSDNSRHKQRSWRLLFTRPSTAVLSHQRLCLKQSASSPPLLLWREIWCWIKEGPQEYPLFFLTAYQPETGLSRALALDKWMAKLRVSVGSGALSTSLEYPPVVSGLPTIPTAY